MSEHGADDFQHEIGQSGWFGEGFGGLGLLILVGGIVLTAVGHFGLLADGPVGEAGSNDAITSGWLFMIEGIGFIVFGAFAILSGWDRHRDQEH